MGSLQWVVFSPRSFGIASLDVGLNGWIDGLTAFSLSGTGSLGLGPYSMNGEAEVSNIGVVACGQPFGSLGASVGFGYLWGGAVTVLYDSCDLGPYTPRESDAVSQSPATFPHAWGDAISSQVAVEIPSGLRVVSFAIKGTDGLPRAHCETLGAYLDGQPGKARRLHLIDAGVRDGRRINVTD